MEQISLVKEKLFIEKSIANLFQLELDNIITGFNLVGYEIEEECIEHFNDDFIELSFYKERKLRFRIVFIHNEMRNTKKISYYKHDVRGGDHNFKVSLKNLIYVPKNVPYEKKVIAFFTTIKMLEEE